MYLPVRIFFPTAAISCLILFSRSVPAQTNSDANSTTSVASPTTAGATATAAAATATAGKTYEVDVPATTVWLDTKIDLLAGAQIQFTATGTASYPSTDSKGQSKVQSFGAEGLARGMARPRPPISRRKFRPWRAHRAHWLGRWLPALRRRPDPKDGHSRPWPAFSRTQSGRARSRHRAGFLPRHDRGD